MMVYLSI